MIPRRRRRSHVRL
ncbi:hypothetical protein EYF80_064825 [Liparis tanakae]|uniref:Uncharacterized protein n=1 Tax=Liparis tanakae TaxID=230148 RepID=A0A4Z2E8B5_9TELE|nr:hypothetical protein EYF80_064825 [Liparis tanakae]